MSWARVEQFCLGASAAFSFASAAIGFRWVASPYFKGYASAAAGFFVLGRWAGDRRPLL
jgi:hypothetical protein